MKRQKNTYKVCTLYMNLQVTGFYRYKHSFTVNKTKNKNAEKWYILFCSLTGIEETHRLRFVLSLI